MSVSPHAATHPRTHAPERGAEPPRTVRTGILGASGTSGAELARLLQEHPAAEVRYATSRGDAGRELDEIEPGAPVLPLRHPDEIEDGEAEVVFLCVPHGTAGAAAERFVSAGARVVDVSGDHRLRSAALHQEIYASPRSQALAEQAVYGLPEFARERVRGARLVANPGCYATTMLVALAPLASAGLLRELAVVDAKSGVSGAGRGANATTHFCSVTDDVRPYKPGRSHRHVAEVEQMLGEWGGGEEVAPLVFNPHLVPLERGIEATMVVRGVDASAVCDAYRRAYRDEPFVRLLPEGRAARIRGVARTNRADLGVFPVDGADAVVVTCALDNLVKGAAGQAIQNMNLMFGLEERLGLPGACC